MVGGGAVGVCVALELAGRGASVTLLERGPDLAWGCSAGNAGIVGPSHVLPLADPAAVRDGLRWMLRPDSPFYVRPRPRVLPWLMRFAAAASPPRVKRHRAILHELAAHSAVLHAELAEAYIEAWKRGPHWKEAITKGMSFIPDRRLPEIKDGLMGGLDEIGEDPTEYGFATATVTGPK